MASPDGSEQLLDSLTTMSNAEATETLNKAFMQGSVKIGLTRADAKDYSGQLHHYFGCPHGAHKHDDNCGHDHADHADHAHELECIRERFQSEGTQVYAAYVALNTVVQKHEELIRKRWLKKTRNQRKAMLLQAWPDMASQHRPDVDLVSTQARLKVGPYNSLYRSMLPYINLEDLTQSKPLLVMLNARGRYPPEEFAYSDLELAPYFKLKKEVVDQQKSKYTMTFLGQKDLEAYGALTEWATESEAEEAISSGHSVHIEHGHQILEIQSTLYSFLVRCYTLILADHLPLDLRGTALVETFLEGNSTYIAASTPDLPPLPETEESYINLNTVIREAPYRRPARLDLARLKALVAARKEQAQDHIWTLREDPSYFSDTVKDHMEHRLELIAPCYRKLQKVMPDSLLYTKGLRTMVHDAYVELFLWDTLQIKMNKLHELSIRYVDQLIPDKHLPPDFFQELVETRFFLEAMMVDCINQMHDGYMSSPPIRPYMVSCHCAPDEPTNYNRRKISDPDVQGINSLFDKIFLNETRAYFGLHILMEMLENELEHCAKAKDFVSPWVTSYVSQLSVISECLHQLHLFQPWAQKVEHATEERKIPLLIEYLKKLSVWRPVQQTTFKGTKLSERGNPSDGKFNYPIHRRPNAAVVGTLRASDAALDTFWETADAHYLKVAGKTPYQVVSHILGPIRIPYRTPPWVEPVRKSRATTPTPEDFYQPLSINQHDPTKQITGHFDRLSIIKDKSKPREKSNTDITLVELIPEPLSSLPDEQPTFYLDRRAYKVFKALFHQPSSTDTPAEIQWTDFLHAMVSTAFSAEKLQGSAWHFQPRNLDVEHGIQFHEPHPSHKIPFIWARRFGRRLARNYGWRGDMFRLK